MLFLAQGRILQSSSPGQENGLLSQVAHLGGPINIQLGNTTVVDLPQNRTKNTRLATPAGAHNAYDFPRIYVKGDVFDGPLHRAILVHVLDGEALHGDVWLRAHDGPPAFFRASALDVKPAAISKARPTANTRPSNTVAAVSFSASPRTKCE